MGAESHDLLRFTAQHTNMHLPLKMMVMVMMWAFTARSAAQLNCDPVTQYEKNGQCCKMCGPGTSMASLGTCLDPQCNICEQNEYQDKYTSESKCQLQKYCDPNKNFQGTVPESMKIRRTCICKVGFHCSSESCITCVAHTACKPGHGVQSKGSHLNDTVCQKCSQGTFSNETSQDSVCKKWTQCQKGYHVQQSGTDISDNICVETSRKHGLVICVVLAVIGVICTATLIYCFCKGKRGDATGKVKDCVESCLGGKMEPPRETKVLIAPPTNDEESTIPELPTSQEECFTRTPEENEDEPSQEMSNTTDLVFSENGNFVTQENGKTEILSRQESQTQTFTD